MANRISFIRENCFREKLELHNPRLENTALYGSSVPDPSFSQAHARILCAEGSGHQTTLGVAICQTVERVKDKTSSEISGRGTIKLSERSITFFSERSRRVK